VASAPLDTWKDWLALHLIEAYALCFQRRWRMNTLPSSARRFTVCRSSVPGGSAEWWVGMDGSAMPSAKSMRSAIFHRRPRHWRRQWLRTLIAAYRKRLGSLEWMDPSTKASTGQAFLLFMSRRIPGTWRDYSSYEVKPDDILATSGGAVCWIIEEMWAAWANQLIARNGR